MSLRVATWTKCSGGRGPDSASVEVGGGGGEIGWTDRRTGRSRSVQPRRAKAHHGVAYRAFGFWALRNWTTLTKDMVHILKISDNSDKRVAFSQIKCMA